MRFDMHCHTKEGSLDGKVPIEEYISILEQKGFRGMLVTDHDSYNGYRKWMHQIKDKKHKEFVVLKGIEYDTIDAGHFLVIMPETLKLRILEMKGLPVAMLIDIVHRYGGILGPAHPCGERYLSFINTKKRRNKTTIISKLDFVEAFNACETQESNLCAAELAEKYNLAGFGGSDSHRADCIGAAYTELPVQITSESALIKYIRDGGKPGYGGTLYKGTTREKIGFFNQFLIQSFWFYNAASGLIRRPKRKRELGKKHLEIWK